MLGILETWIDSLHGDFYGSDNGKLEGLLLGVLLGSTNDKELGSDEGIKLRSTDIKLLSNILGNVDGITLGIDIGTELGFLHGSFDGSNDVKLE